ncbi:MAG: CHAD domain-containing protein [Cyanobacteria bacterium J06632_22]
MSTSVQPAAKPEASSASSTGGAPTLGDFANGVIYKQVKKALSPRKQVLQDTQPEALHQMRVGYRRVQSAVAVFGCVLKVPKATTLGHMDDGIRRLGRVRDLDVLQQWLNQHLPQDALSESEALALATVQQQLAKVRKRQFNRLRKYLKSDDYKTLADRLNRWAADPQHRPPAQVPLSLVLPDLILPQLSDLLQHPGWLVGTRLDKSGLLKPMRRMSLVRINDCLAEQGTHLHDLRKQVKRLRYELEFLAPTELGTALADQVTALRQLQSTLGTLQDETILSRLLVKSLGDDWASQLPTLVKALEQERRQAWKDWQKQQAQYLDPTFRQQLRQQVILRSSTC